LIGLLPDTALGRPIRTSKLGKQELATEVSEQYEIAVAISLIVVHEAIWNSFIVDQSTKSVNFDIAATQPSGRDWHGQISEPDWTHTRTANSKRGIRAPGKRRSFTPDSTDDLL
jgi:hypothetical protein